MEIRLDGKVALVTGASRGIGLAVASEFLESGAAGVVISSRRAESLEAAVVELAEPSRVAFVVAKADRDDDAHLAVRTAIAEFGSCDILINNAGTNPVAGSMADVEMSAVDKTWAVNLRGPLLHAREAWRQWMGEHGGVICNVSSIGGMEPGPDLGAYNVSKAGLIFLTRQLALEMAPLVRVNAVAPGLVKTQMSRLLWESGESDSATARPLQRLGEPRDIAEAVLFLCSDAASWITGVTLPVDGGETGAGLVT